MHTISGLRSSARLGAKSVMNSPYRFAGFTIVSSTGAAMNAHGGSISMSIQCPWRNGCGEHLNAARKLQLNLQTHSSMTASLVKVDAPTMHPGNPETMPCKRPDQPLDQVGPNLIWDTTPRRRRMRSSKQDALRRMLEEPS